MFLIVVAITLLRQIEQVSTCRTSFASTISKKVSVVATAARDSHSPVLYPAAVIKTSANPAAAKNFVEFLAGEKTRAVCEKYGFIPAGV